MDRREFLKMCSMMAAGFALFGCRDGLLGSSSGSRKLPTLSDFEDEVRRAVAQGGRGFELVKVPMPGSIKSSLSTVRSQDSANRFGMAIDLDVCDGCGKCILACNMENNVPLVTEDEAAKNRFMHWIQICGGVPFMCAHCGDAPCEKVCPTGAANHTPDGLSAMMYKRCTGSRFCGANCPLHARKFNFNDAQALGLARKFNDEVPQRGKGVMEKCSMCLQRLQNDRLRFKTEVGVAKAAGVPVLGSGEWRGRGVQTACSEACSKHAIIFGNWLDENSELVKVASRRELYAPSVVAGLDPSVVYMRGRR